MARPIYFKWFIGTVLHRAEISGKHWWRAQLMRDPCPYCGGQSTTREHVIPKSKMTDSHYWSRTNGNIFNNVVGACSKCNNDRGDKPFLIWLGLRNGYMRRINE